VLVTHSAFAATYAGRMVELWDGRIARDLPVVPTSPPAASSPERPPVVLTFARVEK
jgi:hypothetical protein